MKEKKYIFVISSGRAGSTLLQSILNASNQIYIPPESDFIARAYPFFKDKDSLEVSDYRILASIFRMTTENNGWEMEERYVVEYLERYKPQSLSDVFYRICEAFHSLHDTKDLFWGIKRPLLIASIDRILAVCPEAKIVHIYRDGRDVCLSYRKVHESSPVKFGPRSIIPNALYWVNGLRYVEEFGREKPCCNFKNVRYEDILENPEIVFQDLCKFLELEYVPNMLVEFSYGKRAVAPTKLMNSIHGKISSKNIDKNNANKYKSDMSTVQLFFYELLAAPYLQMYGYPLEYPFLNSRILSFPRALLYWLVRIFNDIRYSLREGRIYQKAVRRSS